MSDISVIDALENVNCEPIILFYAKIVAWVVLALESGSMWKNSHHLLGSYCVPATVLVASEILGFNLHNSLAKGGIEYYFTFFFLKR